jgi:hypothetical protein
MFVHEGQDPGRGADELVRSIRIQYYLGAANRYVRQRTQRADISGPQHRSDAVQACPGKLRGLKFTPENAWKPLQGALRPVGQSRSTGAGHARRNPRLAPTGKGFQPDLLLV